MNINKYILIVFVTNMNMSKFCISSHRGGVYEGFTEMWHQRSENYKRLIKLFKPTVTNDEVLVCPYKNYFLGKDDVGRSKFNSRKEGVRGCRGKRRMKREEDLIKTPTYSLCGRGVLHFPSAQRLGWNFRAAEPGEKELPLLPASYGAIHPPETLSPSSHLPSQC